jgi:hypothetical protein
MLNRERRGDQAAFYLQKDVENGIIGRNGLS